MLTILYIMLTLPFFLKTETNNQIWIALIGAATGIGTMLGLNQIVPAIIEWFKARRNERNANKTATKAQYQKLRDRIDLLEKKLDRAERFETNTRSTLSGMIPLMKEMMKEHPAYVALLEKLEQNIIGEEAINTTPAPK